MKLLTTINLVLGYGMLTFDARELLIGVEHESPGSDSLQKEICCTFVLLTYGKDTVISGHFALLQSAFELCTVRRFSVFSQYIH